jgi:hypothetical protein
LGQFNNLNKIVPVLASLTLLAQTTAPQPNPQPGNISGTVTDVNDNAVAGATVVLQGPVTSDGLTVVTNDSGFFEMRDVTTGISYVWGSNSTKLPL